MQHHYYYDYFLGQEGIKHLVNKKPIYKYIKDLFFDKATYKWKIAKYKNFVETNNLNYLTCHSVLDFIFQSHIKSLPKNKGFLSFLQQVEKLNETDNSSKIPIKKGRVTVMIRLILYALTKHSTMGTKAKIDFISDNFNTGLTRNTIRFYYYEDKYD